MSDQVDCRKCRWDVDHSFVYTCGHKKIDEIMAAGTKEIGAIYLGDCKYFEKQEGEWYE